MRWTTADSMRSCGSRPRPYQYGRWPRVRAVGLCLLVAAGVLCSGAAGAARPPVVERVTVQPSDDTLEIRIQTTASTAPGFRAFTLGHPPRLVFDLRGFDLNLAAPREHRAGAAGVMRVRIARFRSDPPVTRVVCDLSVSPDRLRYRTTSSPGDGDLRVIFSGVGAPAAAAPEERHPARPPEPMAPLTAAEPEEGEEPAEQPELGPEEISAGPTQNEAAEAETEAQPEMSPAPAPRPATRRDWLPLVAGLLAAAIVFALGAAGLWLRGRARVRREHAERQRALSSNDPDERLRALRELEGASPSQIGPLLEVVLPALRDPNPQVAEAAQRALQDAFPARELLETLDSGDEERRLMASRLLAFHAPEVIAEPLLKAGASGSLALRAAAVRTLGDTAVGEGIRPLLVALSSEEAERRQVAAEAVARAGRRAVGGLLDALGDPDQSVRLGAIEGLAMIAPEGSARAVSGLLSDPVPEVRAIAARALGRLTSDPDYLDVLLRLLEDPVREVQEAAAVALASTERLPALVEVLNRRACEEPEARFEQNVFDAVAAHCTDPIPELEASFENLNRGFARDMAAAFDRAGRLESWIEQFATADAARLDLLRSLIRLSGDLGAVTPILRGLSASDNRIRSECAVLAGAVQAEGAVDALVELLSVTDPEVRRAAAESLGRIGGNASLSGLTDAVADPSPGVRCAALLALASAVTLRQGGTEDDEGRTLVEVAVEAARSALKDADSDVRAAAAAAVAEIKDPEAAPCLVDRALRDPDAQARGAAVAALSKLQAYETLPLLLEVINDPDPELRRRAIELFAHSGDPAAADVLLGALTDDDLGVRKTATRGLWEIATTGHAAALLPHLRSPDPKVRSAVAGAIGKVRAAEHAGELAEASLDPDPYVRASVVNAFRRLAEMAAEHAEAVSARLADPDAFVRARAAEALAAVTPNDEKAAERVLGLLEDGDPTVQRAAAACVMRFAKRGVHAALLSLLADPARRPQALELIQQADESMLRMLLESARSAPERIARPAMETLSYSLSKRWTPRDLKEELESLDPAVRRGGLEALALIGTPEAMEYVGRLLAGDPSVEIRLRALEILAERDGAEVEGALRRAAAGDPEERVRKAAAELLSALVGDGRTA